VRTDRTGTIAGNVLDEMATRPFKGNEVFQPCCLIKSFSISKPIYEYESSAYPQKTATGENNLVRAT
jgi:hypothetical protein